jgi:hypothetical protein
VAERGGRIRDVFAGALADRRGGVSALAAPAVALAMTLSVGGCGGRHSAQAPSVVPSPQASTRAASFAAYRQCLSDHGVVMPTERPGERPTQGPAPRPSRDAAQAEAFRAARQACESLRPPGGLRAGGFHNGVSRQFWECMRQHGVERPRQEQPGTAPPGEGPTPEPESGRGGLLAGLDLNDPVVHKAVADCRSIVIDNDSTATPDAAAEQ